MTCVSPSAAYWRTSLPDYSDESIAASLKSAWSDPSPKRMGPPYGGYYHDFAAYRAHTLREARKRGLDISVTKLGT